MIEQQQLDFTTSITLSRSNDPKSSKRAAEQIVKSGALKGQCLLTLTLVKENPGMTSKELGQVGTLDRYQVARRLADLFHMNKVRRIEVGNSDCRWWAV